MMQSNAQALLAIQSRLATLDAEKAARLHRQQALLADRCSEPTTVAQPPLILTNPQKIEWFGQRFRRHDDGHADRGEHSQGRRSYTAAWANEWRAGVCEKPKVKGGDCHHHDVLPLTPQVIHETPAVS